MLPCWQTRAGLYLPASHRGSSKPSCRAAGSSVASIGGPGGGAPGSKRLLPLPMVVGVAQAVGGVVHGVQRAGHEAQRLGVAALDIA